MNMIYGRSNCLDGLIILINSILREIELIEIIKIIENSTTFAPAEHNNVLLF